MKAAREEPGTGRSWQTLRILSLVLVLPLSLPAQEPETTDDPLTIRGQVVDAESGSPVAGALVEPPDRRSARVTDPEGRFAIPDLRPGERLDVSLLGYETARVSVPRDGGTLRIELEPDPIVLAGIEVLSDRFEDRRRSVGRTVRVFDRVALLETEYHNVLDLIERRTRLTPSPCPGMSRVTECTRQRGGFQPVVVYVDEVEADLQYLRGYSPRQMYLVEVYRGGSHIRAYTNWWVRSASERGIDLQPFDLPRIRLEHRSSSGPPR